MAKADVRRDYYADLGLAPSAGTEDIKKQFRKLALKYHPDRNPGKELEYNAKFQAIQAAHEILNDPTQRLRYDTDRIRAGYGKFYGPSGAHNIPRKPSAAGANYTTNPSARPQRKPPSSARPSSFHSANAGGPGAQRYASYSRGGAQQPGQKGQDHGQTRADAFRGFQHMKGSSTAWSQFDPRTGQSGYPGGIPRANDGQRPRSAYEHFRASYGASSENANPQSPKKKQGFAPNTPGGDEPMASNTSAYSNTSRTRANRWDSFFESVPSPTARKPAPQAAQAQADKDGTFAERESRGYASTGGERTYFRAAFGRSASMRDPPHSRQASGPYAAGADSANAGRHRSASPKVDSENTPSSDDTTSSSDTEDGNPAFGKRVPTSRLRAREKYAQYRAAHERKWHFGGGGGKTALDSDSAAFSGGAQRPQDRDTAANGGSHFTEKPAQDGMNGHHSDGAAYRAYSYTGYQPSTQAAPNFTKKPAPANDSQNWAFKSNSHGDLRSGFNINDWNGAFQGDFIFKSDGKPASQPGNSQTQQPRNAERSTAASSNDPSAAFRRKPAPFTDRQFRADDWVEQFKNLSWAMPKDDGSRDGNAQASRANSSGSRSPKKQPRPARTRAPQAASVATEAEEAKTTVNPEKQQSAKVDVEGEAMDIDEDQAPTAAAGPGKTSGHQKKYAPQPKKASPRLKAEDRAESGIFNMNNLGKTDPFTSTNSGGIGNLQDIHATLPFDSQAKNSKTTVSGIRPRELNCPNPPKRPRIPSLTPISAGSQQLALPRAAWNRYVTEMNTYMREWNDFNGKMLGHFNARQEAIKTGLAPGWVSAVGDSARLDVGQDDSGLAADSIDDRDDSLVPGTAKGGYSAYLRGLEEDVKVRKHWDVACEMHQECILELGKMREWIRNGGKLV